MEDNLSTINNHGSSSDSETTRFSSRYQRIGYNYQNTEQLKQAVMEAGMESSNLILGIDFTKSNEWTGTYSFDGRCLHDLSEGLNPYQQAISIIGETMASFDEDNLIPCFGFGDVTTHDRDVFAFYEDNRPCRGFEEVLSRYGEIVPHVRLAGPTSFAPIIDAAVAIVDQSGGQYHVLLIIADGQVTRSMYTSGRLCHQEKNTVNAIARASAYPLSIVVVGVGDGPWDMMREYEYNIADGAFDNIQFVNFTEIMSRNISLPHKKDEFFMAALMKIPTQYTATLQLQLLSNQRGHRRILPLPPPSQNLRMNNDPSVSLSGSLNLSSSTSYQTPLPPPSQNLRMNNDASVSGSSSLNLSSSSSYQIPLPPPSPPSQNLRMNNDAFVSQSGSLNLSSSTSYQTPLPPPSQNLRMNNDASVSESGSLNLSSSSSYQTPLPPNLRTNNDPSLSKSHSFSLRSSASYQTPLPPHLRTNNDPSVSRSPSFNHISSTSYQTDLNPSSPASTSRPSKIRRYRNRGDEGPSQCPHCGIDILSLIRVNDSTRKANVGTKI